MTSEIAIQSEHELLNALRNTVYPEASDEALKLVISFCKALQLDPLTKPVHIGKFKGRDTLIPGIGYYRIRAHRTQQYLGMSEPIYGPDVTEKLGDKTITYPSKCTVIVKRLVGDRIAEFAGHAIWKEAYGTIADGITPNSFWYDRPYGQSAKVAESDALRKAFPDLVTHQPTFEETVGNIDSLENQHLTDAQIAVANANNKLKADLKANLITAQATAIENSNWIKDDLVNTVLNLTIEANTSMDEISGWLKKAQVASVQDLSEEQLHKIIDKLKRDVVKYGQ